jgi:cell wall assembly regulator SMI1
LIELGDQPPYPYEGDGTNLDTVYPGGETNVPNLVTHDFDTITSTTISGMSRMKGGNFPCGLMNFAWIPSSTAGITIQVDLVPGTHRGYLCEPMTEM